MASPQIENGHLDIANELVEQLAKSELSGSEFRVCFYIWRKTWSWHKKSDNISITQIEKGTNLSRKMVVQTINKLVTKRLLLKSKNYISTLQFNKHYEEWVVTNRTLGSYQKVTRVVTKCTPKLVTKSKPTKENKETITKEITTNVVTGFGNPDINSLLSYFLEKFQLPKEDCSQRQSRRYWYLLLRESKTGLEGVKWLIDQAIEDDFLKPNITSGKDLYYKRIKILARKRATVPKIAIMPKGEAYGQKMEANNWDRSLLLN